MSDIVTILLWLKEVGVTFVLIWVLWYAVYYMANKIEQLHLSHKEERQESNKINNEALTKISSSISEMSWAMNKVGDYINVNTIETTKNNVVLGRLDDFLHKK